MSKAGSMAASMAWLFAIGAGVLGVLAGRFVPGFIPSFIVATGIFVAGGWATVHMTQASTGRGILAVLVGAVVAAVVAFIVYKSAVSAGMSQMGTQFDEAMKQAQAQGKPLTPEQKAQMQQAGAILSGAGSSLAGAGAALWALIKTFLWGMIGCFIGGATKKSATGGGAAMQKAA